MSDDLLARIKNKGRRCFLGLGIAVASCLVVLPACDTVQVAFRDASTEDLTALQHFRSANGFDFRVAARRERFVEIEPGLIETLTGEQPMAKSIYLNLFSDSVYFVAIDDFEDVSEEEGRRVLHGHVTGSPGGDVVIALSGSVMVADVALASGERYTVGPTGSGVYRIREADPSVFRCGQDGTGVPEQEPASAVGTYTEERPPVFYQSESTIDVMVVYTEAAKERAGGADGIQDWIRTAVKRANQAYSDSGVTQSLNLVHSVEVQYQEHGRWETVNGKLEWWDEHRTALEDAIQGNVADVHDLRDTYGADQVSFWIDAPQPAGLRSCGLAKAPETRDQLDIMSEYAYSVVNAFCEDDLVKSFAHELAHNQGAHHDPKTVRTADRPEGESDWTLAQFVDYANAAPDWTERRRSFGYCDPDGVATIMAYGWVCGATDVMYFSNPDLALRVIYDDGYVDYDLGGEWSDVRSLLNTTYGKAVRWRSTPIYTLPTPVVQGPIGNELVCSAGQPLAALVGLRWEGVAGALQYWLEVADAEGNLVWTGKLSAQQAGCGSGGDCAFPTPGFAGPELEPGSYRWSVRAGALSGGSAWSDWASFELEAQPIMVDPVVQSNSLYSGLPITFEWQNYGADRFWFMVGPYSNGFYSRGYLDCTWQRLRGVDIDFRECTTPSGNLYGYCWGSSCSFDTGVFFPTVAPMRYPMTGWVWGENRCGISNYIGGQLY